MNPVPTPIHIYVLWHPQFAEGRNLAAEIYRWFRLDTIEGIPVFFRSTNAKRGNRPLPIERRADTNADVIDYVIPLVDAHMVADPVWREWLVELKESCGNPAEAQPGSKLRMYPVAVDSLAFQAPTELRALNFIRHDITRQPSPDLDVLLSALTEVLCRDLRYHLHGNATADDDKPLGPPSKIKIFLSHAKADGTDEVRRLKQHIQSQTQCETFFDETDIPSGEGFSDVLDQAIGGDSAGMIVIHGSEYAERPWCRREIRSFQKPRPDQRSAGQSEVPRAFFVPPVVVVENMGAKRVSRSIPELGFAPALRWAPGSERRIVNTLLREILLGFFHRLLIRNAVKAKSAGPGDILVNRSPDPLLTQRLIHEASRFEKGHSTRSIHYPGYGLSQMELAALREAYPNVDFKTLADLADPDRNTTPASPGNPIRVLRLSVGESSDILDGGYGDQHNQELLLRLLRPLAREGVSILYGGVLPQAAGGLSAWEVRSTTGERFVNFTSTCVHVLIAERDHFGDGTDAGSGSRSKKRIADARLFSMPVWPESDKVTHEIVAKWVDVCSFRPVTPDDLSPIEPMPRDSARPELRPRTPPEARLLDRSEFDSAAEWRAAQETHDSEIDEDIEHNEILAACCLTRMRTMVCDPNHPVEFLNLNRHHGGGDRIPVLPIAHVFLGGKLTGWSGIAPGIFEEFAAAVLQKQPIFLIGAGQGAAGAIARWLTESVRLDSTGAKPPFTQPPEFTTAHCRQGAKNPRLTKAFDQWRQSNWLPRNQWVLEDILTVIAEAVHEARGDDSPDAKPDLARVLNNGLSHEANRELLHPETSHGTICKWIHHGLRNLAQQTGASGSGR